MSLDFEKQGGLIPAVIQDATTRRVLMVGYMNEEALKITRDRLLVTFFSRSKGLWTKGDERQLPPGQGDPRGLRPRYAPDQGDPHRSGLPYRGDTCFDEKNDPEG